MKKKWIIIFCCVQAIGAICLPLANVHSNVIALLLVVVFLFPGTIIFGIFPEIRDSSASMAIAVAVYVSVNAAAWYAVSKIQRIVRSRWLVK